jgi:aspartate aminotransferase
MGRLQDHSTSNPVTFAQDAAITALKDPNNEVEKMRVEFEKRAQYMVERLNSIKGIKCTQPTGAFYCFPDVSAHFGKTKGGIEIGSMDFAELSLSGKCRFGFAVGAKTSASVYASIQNTSALTHQNWLKS